MHTKYTNGLDVGRNHMSLQDWCNTMIQVPRSSCGLSFCSWSKACSSMWGRYGKRTSWSMLIPRPRQFPGSLRWIILITPGGFQIICVTWWHSEVKHPDVFAQFLTDNFTVKKTTPVFSAIAIDQVHEQNDATVKGDGGAVCLTENPAALWCWMVRWPYMPSLIG